ncbi:hypothetical protein SLEP1_g54146 [Rubroshorea leprosula]|uniref:TFIIS N-terminal domain-containing protein n=1 Tax=Rubroshorea leprosula TaxID=152421 RepID=A0AAV5MDZ5_9ROSI|nr:hypothetical protein SLEP1_g54146 [Rubroshorea leprosula]
MSMSVSGTVVIQSPRGTESLSLQSSVSSSQRASLEEALSSGTVVVRGQNDGSDSPRTPKSRVGILERNSNASLEDSAASLAEVVDMPVDPELLTCLVSKKLIFWLMMQAKAAVRAGLRKGNARERSALGMIDISAQESQRGDEMANSSDSSRDSLEYFDPQRAFTRSCQASHNDERAKIASSSAPLSMLLIPSLKEALADDLEGLVVRAVTNSLVNMEHKSPGSCEALVRKLLERLASSKESSLKEMQEMAIRMFIKGKTTSEAGNRRQQQKELHTSSNIIPLARFLLSRWQTQVSNDLNPA